MFDQILLEREQDDLLIMLVEASRNIPREDRQKFMFQEFNGGAFIRHPGLKDSFCKAYKGDLETLGRAGLLALSYDSKDTLLFDVTPRGFKYYEHLKELTGQPIQQVENFIHSYLDGEKFQQKYPSAYQKWIEAERILWGSDSEQQLTTIGHLCREAIQEFVTALVEHHQPPNVTNNKANTVARMKAILNLHTEKFGTTIKPFLDALLVCWGTTSDLIQRQEHGGQKEGDALIWEDGRRVVFSTGLVMFEIDRALS